MSPASRSKSKDKKARKEPPMGYSKPSGHVNSSGGIPASGYNPLLGTFHTFETPPASPLHVNGRSRNMDDTDDQSGNTFGTGIEYDTVSNNGSWSVESEDHKEKPSQPTSRQESVPGTDNDKREKIRQKNERKHQRQKERRAQELHERCSGYLMSRKLEGLAVQLVSMGFSQERATMALILNEGRVEESVAWLFEEGEEEKRMEQNLDGGGSLKIDISEELARITDMETRYKASKQEVERAVVAFEGDLEKAEEMLKTQKQEPPAVSPTPEETGDPPTTANGKLPIALNHNAIRLQTKLALSPFIQQKNDDKDFNYNKVANRSVSCSSPSPLQASSPPTRMKARYLAVGNELKNLQLGSMREPVTMMQRPQSVNSKQAPTSSVRSSPPGAAMGWYPNNLEMTVGVTRSISPGSKLFYNQQHYQPQQANSSSIDSQRENGLWSRGGASPTLSAASSLGLFSGLGSSGSSSPVNWSTGNSMLQLDYTNIDWSLDMRSSRFPNGNGRTYDSFGYGMGVKSAIRPVVSNRKGASVQEGVEANSAGWSSPFEENELFSVPRQFVSSPSL